ncbi:MAG: YciI family protein [Candidatus Dormiibacterota bacterium]
MARYAISMYAPAEEPAADRGPGGREPYDRYATALRASGALVAAFALDRTAAATSMRGTMVTDGPFAETKEVVIGLYVVEAADLAAALEIARRNPILADGGGIEVRAVEPD